MDLQRVQEKARAVAEYSQVLRTALSDLAIWLAEVDEARERAEAALEDAGGAATLVADGERLAAWREAVTAGRHVVFTSSGAVVREGRASR